MVWSVRYAVGRQHLTGTWEQDLAGELQAISPLGEPPHTRDQLVMPAPLGPEMYGERLCALPPGDWPPTASASLTYRT